MGPTIFFQRPFKRINGIGSSLSLTLSAAPGWLAFLLAFPDLEGDCVSSVFVFITIHPYDLPTTDSAAMADTDPAPRAAGFEDLVKLMEKQTELTGRLLVETEIVRKGLAGASTLPGNGMSKI